MVFKTLQPAIIINEDKEHTCRYTALLLPMSVVCST